MKLFLKLKKDIFGEVTIYFVWYLGRYTGENCDQSHTKNYTQILSY